jgi:hypothetical protein
MKPRGGPLQSAMAGADDDDDSSDAGSHATGSERSLGADGGDEPVVLGATRRLLRVLGDAAAACHGGEARFLVEEVFDAHLAPMTPPATAVSLTTDEQAQVRQLVARVWLSPDSLDKRWREKEIWRALETTGPVVVPLPCLFHSHTLRLRYGTAGMAPLARIVKSIKSRRADVPYRMTEEFNSYGYATHSLGWW